MDDFADVAKARAAYKTFSAAIEAGRAIVQRAGVPDPPPVPQFDTVFRRLSPELRDELYMELRKFDKLEPTEAIRFWQPFIRRAFGHAKA